MGKFGEVKLRNTLRVSVFVGFLLIAFFLVNPVRLDIFASNCPASDYQCQIDEIQREIDALSPAHEKNKQDLAGLQKQLADIKKRLTTLSNQLTQLGKDIDKREEDLAYQQELLNVRARSYYIRARQYSPIVTFLFSDSAAKLAREIAFREQTANQDRVVIEKIAGDIVKLNSDKKKLETNQKSLSSLQKDVDERAKFLAQEVSKVESYLTTLSSKQQELIALKSGGFSTSVGDTPATLVPCSGPPGSSNFCDPGNRPAIAVFSFGAPHRTGMSQYGAYGRSKSGQNAEAILSAYYKGSELRKDYQSPGTIGVTGYGRIPFEENYLLGIYEVPEGWGDSGGFEALKAQAVAARTYALAVTNNGSGTICTTEACQVYKPQLKGGKWAEAVRATRGWVLIKDGQPAKTYYASTSGGFTISQWGWSGIVDTPGGSTGNWPDQAYEKVGGSPWFYMGWYKNRSGNSCGRGSPWLTENEFADILNSWVVYKSGDVGRISPVDTSCWKGSPYTIAEMKDRADSVGGSYSKINSVSVIYSNDGSTQNVFIATDRGSVTISGSEFKTVFNLRAPGYVGIKSSLFNVVKL